MLISSIFDMMHSRFYRSYHYGTSSLTTTNENLPQKWERLWENCVSCCLTGRPISPRPIAPRHVYTATPLITSHYVSLLLKFTIVKEWPP